MKQDYELRLTDWIPVKGFIDYINRNEPDKKTIPRGQILNWYNKGLCITGVLTLVGIALENLLD